MSEIRAINVCTAIRRDGAPCTARVLGDSSSCWAHDPELGEHRRQVRALGGKGRSNAARAEKLMPARLRPVCDRLEGALTDVLSGTLDPRQASAAAALARALVAVLTAGELEQRVRDLESREMRAW